MTQNMKKLAGEVDRCLKKVAEGAELFEDIWQKVQNATNLNQKEKSESELKREIKKLQRLREQIKMWLASSEIKDKKLLLENRKLIELQMERFRIVEKETKTKAYSKEGLGQASKVNPETKEYELCREWINDVISRLNIQIDQMESETESLYACTKKKKLDKDQNERVDELNERVERHRYHIKNLEHILRSLDNESLDVDSVNKVQEDIEYYVDTCQEPDFIDCEGIYDDLDLETDGDAEAVKGFEDDEDDLQSSPGSSINSAYSSIATNSPISKSTSSSPRKNSKNSVTSAISILANGISNSTSVVTSTTSTPSKRTLFPENTTSSSPAVTTTPLETTVTNTTTSLGNSFQHQTPLDYIIQNNNTPNSIANDLAATSMAPYVDATTVVSTSNNILSNNNNIARPPSPTSKLLTSVEQNAVQVVRNHVESLKYPGFNSNNPLWRTTSSAGISETTNPVTTAISSMSNSLLPNSEPLITTLESSLLSSISRPVSSTSILPMNTSTQNSVPYQPVSSVTHKLGEHLQAPLDFNSLKTNSLFGGVLNSTLPLRSSVDTQEVRLQPVHGVAPLGPVLLTPERLYQLKMLDHSYIHLPQKQDSEKMRPYVNRNPVPIASYHHHQAPPNIDSLEFFQRLSPETLFFIFYYQEGTRAQYSAAKALKKQSWRFHTKYMMWFQRHEEPKRITDEFEEGTYIYFDFEKWSQGKRDGFTFEYRFLEDKDLP